MLARSRKISKTLFKSLGRGVSYHSPTLSLFVYKKSDQTESQFSFLCSKKVSKSAVTRNRLRRQGYASVEKVLSSVKRGYYCVFSYKKFSKQPIFSEISKTVLQLLSQAHLL